VLNWPQITGLGGFLYRLWGLSARKNLLTFVSSCW